MGAVRVRRGEVVGVTGVTLLLEPRLPLVARPVVGVVLEVLLREEMLIFQGLMDITPPLPPVSLQEVMVGGPLWDLERLVAVQMAVPPEQRLQISEVVVRLLAASQVSRAPREEVVGVATLRGGLLTPTQAILTLSAPGAQAVRAAPGAVQAPPVPLASSSSKSLSNWRAV